MILLCRENTPTKHLPRCPCMWSQWSAPMGHSRQLAPSHFWAIADFLVKTRRLQRMDIDILLASFSINLAHTPFLAQTSPLFFSMSRATVILSPWQAERSAESNLFTTYWRRNEAARVRSAPETISHHRDADPTVEDDISQCLQTSLFFLSLLWQQRDVMGLTYVLFAAYS